MDSKSDDKHGQRQAAGAIRPSLPWCLNVAEAGGGVCFGSLGKQVEAISGLDLVSGDSSGLRK